jgi:hypothetical protein
MSERENELQKIFRNQMREVQKLYPPVIEEILKELAKGETVAVAVDKGFKSAKYESKSAELTVGNTMNASGLGLGEQLSLNLNLAPDYFLYTNFANGVNLSDTIRSGEAQAEVKRVLKEWFKYKNNVKQLQRKLNNLKTAPRVKIPNELRELVRLRDGFAADSKQVKKQADKALKQVDQLNKRGVTETRQLKSAYKKLIDSVLVSDKVGVQKAMDFAFKQKVNYINQRIARSEFAKSYEMSFQRQIEEDPLIIGWQWVLSSAHPRTDICDFYAKANLYGMGRGVYPKGAGVFIPAHPNCLCTKVPVYGDRKKGRYSKERAEKFLWGLPLFQRKLIIGAKHSQHKKDFQAGLNKQGFQITAKPRMISKTILKGGDE